MSDQPMLEIVFIPPQEFDRVRSVDAAPFQKLALIADMCRVNALSAVKLAGSGHLGSSFSAMDIVTYLYFHEMNVFDAGPSHPDRDIYFSSKGHDCPGLYAVLAARGLLAPEMLHRLRRLDGLDGHPDVKIPGIEANSGSLGMGISKAKGMALAKQLAGRGGRVIVMTGDGELQEGQIWESLQTTAHQGVCNITVIVDHNKIQTDRPIDRVMGLRDLEKKFGDFGWHVERCDGHEFRAIEGAFERMKGIRDKPKILIADTVKGKGVSFMEGPRALVDGAGLYQWHSGAPDDDAYEASLNELRSRLDAGLGGLHAGPIQFEVADRREKGRIRLKDTAEKVVEAYGEALVELGGERPDLVVLDADLASDCGLRPFEARFPDRFIENGIAEQDMVSMAGGLALQGLLPVVNSFGVFLASRANEQIYTNASEETRIIYVCHLAGLIPAGPGKSHQSIRDISLFGALPNCTIVEPCNGEETRQLLRWCVQEARETCMLRLVISPSPRTIVLPDNYGLSFGQGTLLRPGNDGVLFTYGPVMLHEALLASELLESSGYGLKVVNMPWLNRVDDKWLVETIAECPAVFVVDNHSPVGGLGDSLLNALAGLGSLCSRSFHKFAVEGYPACGTPQEALAFHRLDGGSLVPRILQVVER